MFVQNFRCSHDKKWHWTPRLQIETKALIKEYLTHWTRLAKLPKCEYMKILVPSNCILFKKFVDFWEKYLFKKNQFFFLKSPPKIDF